MLDWLLDWLNISNSDKAPVSQSHLAREADAETIFYQRTIELKITHEERNRLRQKVSSISQKIKVISDE
tara:strand:+ start:2337 stop:2543 length:207 start_codon:yes stop_codon:yes gene_type:complete